MRCDEGKRGQRNILPELSKYFSSLRPFAVVYSRAKRGNKFPSFFYRLLRPSFFSPLYPISRPVTRSFCDSLFYFIRRKQGRIFSGDFVGRRDEEARRRRRRRQNSRRRRSRDRLLAEQARNITSSRANLELKNGAR